jgi:hypothetical protein
MLDIRAVAYIAPVSEVDFAPVPLTIRLVNYADETGLVSAGFRIYNGITGLLIHQSDIIPVEIAKGATVDVSALTDFMPPAPADDTYFVLFDGNAANALVPDGIAIHLGSMYFDVKPAPLGPIPAGHAVTHEDTGIDEVDVTGLSGLLADPQTPILHHLEHEAGGADEVNVAGLAGELADDQPPKAHGNAAHTSTFEDQANKGVAGGYCGLPNPLNTTLPLRADGLAARPLSTLQENDFLHWNSFGVQLPWFAAAISSGTAANVAGLPLHPGIFRITSAAGANSGELLRTDPTSILLSGGEIFTLSFSPKLITALLARAGFHDTVSSADATDGVYIEVVNVGGVEGTLVGKTAAAGARSTTASSFVLTIDLWYTIKVALNSNATLATFYLYDDTGALLWSDTLNTNIPTAAGQETACAFMFLKTSASATLCAWIDYASVEFRRDLNRKLT